MSGQDGLTAQAIQRSISGGAPSGPMNLPQYSGPSFNAGGAMPGAQGQAMGMPAIGGPVSAGQRYGNLPPMGNTMAWRGPGANSGGGFSGFNMPMQNNNLMTTGGFMQQREAERQAAAQQAARIPTYEESTYNFNGGTA